MYEEKETAPRACFALPCVSSFGGEAARRWYRSASADGATAASWNRRAALATALSVGLGAASVLIDSFWVAPAASFG